MRPFRDATSSQNRSGGSEPPLSLLFLTTSPHRYASWLWRMEVRLPLLQE